jgi:hypothetical protein
VLAGGAVGGAVAGCSVCGPESRERVSLFDTLAESLRCRLQCERGCGDVEGERERAREKEREMDGDKGYLYQASD